MKTWLKRIFPVLVVCTVILVVQFAVAIRSTIQGVPDAYAIWGTGDLIVGHLEETGEFPKSWEELTFLRDDGHPRTNKIESIEQLKKVVDIRFDRLEEHRGSARLGVPPAELITAISGSVVRWEGADADEMIVEYLAGELE